MRFRFTLRRLLVLILIFSCMLLLMVRPTFTAKRWIQSIERGDYTSLAELAHAENIQRVETKLENYGWDDFWRFRRRINFNIYCKYLKKEDGTPAVSYWI